MPRNNAPRGFSPEGHYFGALFIIKPDVRALKNLKLPCVFHVDRGGFVSEVTSLDKFINLFFVV